MIHCRMCSQRLTRPGRLCRECERELDRARATATSVENLSSAVEVIDAARRTGLESLSWSGGRTNPTVVVAAFAVSITMAIALYVVQGSHAADNAQSVMIDRDLSRIRPREVRTPAAAATRFVEAASTKATVEVAHRVEAGYDRVLGLADALDHCARQSPFDRIACESRARSRYCEAAGANRIAQCADAAADGK